MFLFQNYVFMYNYVQSWIEWVGWEGMEKVKAPGLSYFVLSTKGNAVGGCVTDRKLGIYCSWARVWSCSYLLLDENVDRPRGHCFAGTGISLCERSLRRQVLSLVIGLRHLHFVVGASSATATCTSAYDITLSDVPEREKEANAFSTASKRFF